MPLPNYLQSGGQPLPHVDPGPVYPAARQSTQRRPRRLKLAALGLVGTACLGVTGLIALHDSTGHNPAPQVAPSSSLLVAAPPERNKAVCLDKSGSVDQDHQLATTATKVLQSTVRSLYPTLVTTPDWQPVAPIAGLNLWVRVIRSNSYETQDAAQYTVQSDVPSTPGLAAGMPTNVDDTNYTTAADAWSAAYASVDSARKATPRAQTALATKLGALTAMTSDGSDISGCVAAMTQVLQPLSGPKSYLVVTDGEDTLTENPDGSPRRLDGHFNGPLTLVLACPSGDPQHCASVKQAFLARLAPLGLNPASVMIYRAEQVTLAIQNWLKS